MKISDKDKGFVTEGSILEHYFETGERVYDTKAIENGEIDIEAAEEEYDRQIMLALEEKARKEKEWEKNGLANFEKLRELQKNSLDNRLYIGERVLYLREQLELEPKDVYEPAGIVKSTLYRIENGPNCPTVQVIQKVLYSLQVTLADFSCFPDDFERWKKAITEPDNTYDIYKFRKEMLRKLEQYCFTYKLSGKETRFPRTHLNLIRNLLESSFAILDIVPHDEQ